MKRAITLATGLVLASSFAFAGGDKKIEESFTDLDTNRDGVISEAEAQASPTLMANFKDADTNMDGKLQSREFSAIRREVEEAE